MISTQCLVQSTSCISASVTANSSVALLTLQGDGVACVDVNNKNSIRSWPLGSPNTDFAAPAVYDSSTQRYFAAIKSTTSAASTSSVVSWPISAQGGTIKQCAESIDIKHNICSILPIHSSTTASLQSQHIQEGVQPLEPPAVYAVATNGSIALCSTSSLLSESTETKGSPAISAAVDSKQTLFVIHRKNSSSYSVSAHTIRGSRLRCEMTSLLVNDNDSSPIAAVCCADRAMVMYSNSVVAVYDLSNLVDAKHAAIQPIFTRHLSGFSAAALQSKTGKSAAATTSKKRSKRESMENGSIDTRSSTSIGLIQLTKKGLVAVVDHSSDGMRLVVLDVIYGAVQLAQTINSSDLGTSVSLDTHKSIQGCALKTDGSVLAFTFGGAPFCCVLKQLSTPTLANLLGALNITDIQTSSSSGNADDDDIVVAATPKTNSKKRTATTKTVAATSKNTAASGKVQQGVNPLVAAATSALDAAELQRLATSDSVRSSAVVYSLLSTPRSRNNAKGAAVQDQAVVSLAQCSWQQPQLESIVKLEAAAWEALGNARVVSDESQFDKMVASLVNGCSKKGTGVSYQLLCKILTIAAENQYWKSIDTVISQQHPESLAGLNDVPAVLARYGRYDTLHNLLPGGSDLTSDELLAMLQAFLTSSAQQSKQVIKAQQAYRAQLIALAEKTVATAEKASSPEELQASSAAAACVAGAVTGFTAAQTCMHPLLMCQHDAAITLGALRQLTASQAVRLLRYLSVWLVNYADIIRDAADAAVTITDAHFVLPSLATILEWTSLAFDSNMSRLMTRTEAVEIVAKIKSVVGPQLVMLKNLGRLKGAVEHIQCGAPIPAPAVHAAPNYTMEWLDLRVK